MNFEFGKYILGRVQMGFLKNRTKIFVYLNALTAPATEKLKITFTMRTFWTEQKFQNQTNFS